jgi:hypothetical protein
MGRRVRVSGSAKVFDGKARRRGRCRSGGQIGGVVDKWWCFREKLMVSAMRVSE